MTKSKDIMESLDEEELKILLLCFSKPKVMEAMRIYNTIPGHGKKVFYEEGEKQMIRLKILNQNEDIKELGVVSKSNGLPLTKRGSMNDPTPNII